MRKDIFIVGARLLGIWYVIGAVGPCMYFLTGWFENYWPPSYNQEYNLVIGSVHLFTGLYLLFWTHNLFNFLERMTTRGGKKLAK